MSVATPPRPPLLVTVCAYIGVVCAIQCATAASAVSAWTSIDGQKDRRSLIDALVDSGLARGAAETSYRIFLIAIAGVAAMCVVLAIYTAMSHRTSRTVLTVLAVFVAAYGAIGPFFSQIQSMFLLLCIAQLWSGELRRYFRGEAPVVRPPRPAPVASAVPTSAPAQHAQPTQAVQQLPFAPPAPTRPPLPQPISIAAWTGLIGSLLVTAFCALMLFAFAIIGGDYDRVLRESRRTANMVRDSGMDVDTLFLVSTIVAAVLFVLGVIGLLCSIALLTGRRHGGTALLVMAAVSVVVSIVAFPFGIPWTVAAIIVIVQLRKPESRAWLTKT